MQFHKAKFNGNWQKRRPLLYARYKPIDFCIVYMYVYISENENEVNIAGEKGILVVFPGGGGEGTPKKFWMGVCRPGGLNLDPV